MAWADAPGFHADIQLPKIRVRNERGHFTSAQAQLFADAREQMILQQGEVGARIRNNMVRKSVSTGRLLRVTMDPKNVVSARTSEDQFTVGLGNVEWLDRSIARYWRTIEEGSAATWTKRSFMSLNLQGIWGPNLGHYNRPANPWVGLGEGDNEVTGPGQEMYHPFRKGRGGGPSGLPIFHPKHDIRPMNAYRDVAQNPNFARHNLLIAAKFINKVMTPGFIHNPPRADGSQFYAGY